MNLTQSKNKQYYLLAMIVISLLLLSLYYLNSGSYSLSIVQIITAILGDGEQYHDLIIWEMRLPRLLTAIFAGALFAMSGAIFQSIIRNPLASPDVIGFNPGIALGAVLAVVVFEQSGFSILWGALFGGILTAVLVLACAYKGSKHFSFINNFWHQASSTAISPYRIVLIGIGIGLAFYALVDFILTRSDLYKIADVLVWLRGSVNAKTWFHANIGLVSYLVLLGLVSLLIKSIDQLEMGDDTAVALGIHINRLRLAALSLAVLMVVVAVAMVGPVAFVAFVSGPIARRLSYQSGSNIILAGFIGAIVLLFADLLSRLAIYDLQLSAGIYTAMIGAPYLLWVLAINIRKGYL